MNNAWSAFYKKHIIDVVDSILDAFETENLFS